MVSMNKLCEKIKTVISAVISIMLFIMTLWIIVVCMSKPSDNLIGRTMFFTSMITATVMMLFLFLVSRYVSKNRILNNVLFYGGLCAYTLFLYAMGCLFRNPDAMHDVSILKAAADDMANNRTVEMEWYFSSMRQNFKMTLLLSYIQRIATVMHIEVYFLELVVGVILVLGAIFSVRYLMGRDKQEREKYQCVVLLFFITFLPMICYVQMIYTDTYSFGAGIIAIALFKKSVDCIDTKKFEAYIFAILSGICIAFASAIKITSLIPIIAFSIIYIVKIKKFIIPVLGITVISTIAFAMLFNICSNRYELYRLSENRTAPIIHWFALGINGDGSWTENEEYGRAILEFETTEEKTEYAIAYIKSHISELTNIRHHIAKTRSNFASGTANIKQVVGISGDDSILQNVYGYNGKYYWRMCQLSFSYMFALWIFILIGTVLNIYNIATKKMTDELLSALQLAIIGMIMFMMLWETSNRQMFNQMPTMIMCAIYSMRLLMNKISRSKKNA